MHLTWHIVKKDLRHLSPWLALFVGVILLRYLHALALDTQLYGASPASQILHPEFIDWSLYGLALLCTALIAAMLVHNDPVTGHTSFWVTRPISGIRLLVAKSTTLCLALVALPLALQLLWWSLHGCRTIDIRTQLPASLLPHAGIAFAAFFLALLTRDLGRFVITVLLAWLGSYVTLGILFQVFPLASSPLEDLVSQLLQNGILIATALGCIAVQYFTRRTRLTVGLFSLLTPLGLGVGLVTISPPPPAFERYPTLASAPALEVKALTTTPARDENLGAWTGERYEHGHILDVAISLKNISGDSSVHLQEIVSSTLPLEAKSFPKNYYVLPGPPSRLLREQVVHVALSDPQNPRSTPTLTQPHETTLHFLQRRLQIVARLPLRDRASASYGPYKTEIVHRSYVGKLIAPSDGPSVKPSSHRLHTVTVRETEPASLIDTDARFPETFGADFRGGLGPHATYYLVRDGEIIPVEKIEWSSRLLSTDGIERWSSALTFPVEITEADFARYELVKVIAPVVGTFKRTVTIPPSVPGTQAPQSAPAATP